VQDTLSKAFYLRVLRFAGDYICRLTNKSIVILINSQLLVTDTTSAIPLLVILLVVVLMGSIIQIKQIVQIIHNNDENQSPLKHVPSFLYEYSL